MSIGYHQDFLDSVKLRTTGVEIMKHFRVSK